MKKYILGSIFLLLATFIIAQVRIDTPTLVYPTDNAIKLHPLDTLDWNAVIDADLYQIQLAENESFTVISFDSITELTCFEIKCLFFNYQHYWRVRAIEDQDTSYWTPTWSFTTWERLELSKPNNNSDDQVADVVLKWKNRITGNTDTIAGVEFYDIQIDTDPGFSTPNFAEFTTNGTTYEKKMDQLLFGTEYHWRVRARHACGSSEWSAVWKFTTLDIIELYKPNNNSIEQALNVNLRWDDLSGFKKYDYQVDIDENFSTATTYITELTTVEAEDLKYGTKYFWRVRGRHDYDTTNWSAVWNFTTWAKVNLTSPAEGVDSVELKPQLKWSQIQGTTGYEVEYSSDSLFATSEKYQIPADDATLPSFNVSNALDAATMYFWRVRAYTEIYTSEYSNMGRFVTMPAAGINDDFFGTSSLSVYPNPASNVLNIKLNNSEDVDVELEIIDLVGQAIINRSLHFRAGDSQQQILLNDISNGVYMVKFIKDDAIYTSKLIINK